jgi:hypothetical protein
LCMRPGVESEKAGALIRRLSEMFFQQPKIAVSAGN